MALAALARDEYCAFVGASAVVIGGVSDPDTAEAMAVREGLALAREWTSWGRACGSPLIAQMW